MTACTADNSNPLRKQPGKPPGLPLPGTKHLTTRSCRNGSGCRKPAVEARLNTAWLVGACGPTHQTCSKTSQDDSSMALHQLLPARQHEEVVCRDGWQNTLWQNGGGAGTQLCCSNSCRSLSRSTVSQEQLVVAAKAAPQRQQPLHLHEAAVSDTLPDAAPKARPATPAAGAAAAAALRWVLQGPARPIGAITGAITAPLAGSHAAGCV